VARAIHGRVDARRPSPVWLVRPFHVFQVGRVHYVYDVHAVAAFRVSPETGRALKKVEPSHYDRLGRISEDQVPAPLRHTLRSELDQMGLLSEAEPVTVPSPAALDQRCRAFVVKLLMFALSTRCNLDCVYCYEVRNGFRDTSAVISLKTAKNAIDHFLAQAGNESVVIGFAGGEALLEFARLREIVDYARRAAKQRRVTVGFRITTNGTVLDSEKIAFLRRHRFVVLVSLDGPAEAQDKNRRQLGGQGSYATVAGNVGKLLRIIPDASVHATVTSEAADYARIAAHHRQIGFKQTSFGFAVPNQREKFSAKELRELKAGYVLGGWKHDGRAQYMRGLLTGRRDCLVYCDAALGEVAVAPDGALYPCAGFFGAKKHQIGDAGRWIDHDLRMRYLARTFTHAKTGCQDCWAWMACLGGCANDARLMHGDVAAPGQGNCDLFRFQLELAVDALASEPPPACKQT
jgi:uncharacterized protein